MKMMDIYVQETITLQYMKMIPELARLQVLQVASFFHQVLSRSIIFTDAILPETIWFFFTPNERRFTLVKMGKQLGVS
jgi:hypothetical protein